MDSMLHFLRNRGAQPGIILLFVKIDKMHTDRTRIFIESIRRTHDNTNNFREQATHGIYNGLLELL